jgi:DNA topoisomerase-1
MTARLTADLDSSRSAGEAATAVFQATGKVIDFPGFLRVYVENVDEQPDDLSDQERILPEMKEGDAIDCRELEAKEHKTLPPARFTEASLVKELETAGIGRPSTYASIIDTIQRREYTFKEGSALVPTFLAFAVVNLLDRHFPDLVDSTFTARLEDDLDSISRGEEDSLSHLKEFYFGNGTPGLRQQLDAKVNGIDPREVCTIPLGEHEGEPVVVRVGRYGPFLQKGEDTAPIPDNEAPGDMTLERGLEILSRPRGPRSLGTDPETGLEVSVREGRFGPYVQLGELEDAKEKPKTQSLLKSMDSSSIDFETALQLLRLPRVVGQDEDGVDVTAAYGRYGAYIKRGSDTRSLEDENELFTLSIEKALELLKQPKKGRRRGSEPLKILGESKDLGAEVRVMKGPYGVYVTDGTTNATVPKGVDPQQVSLQQAEDLIKERMARGPVRRRKKAGGKKAGTRKTTTRKTTRKTAGKKSAKKRSSTKKTTTRKASKKSGSRKKTV